MPRKPSTRFFPSRNAYYCQLNGKQHYLGPGPEDGPNGPNFTAAVKAYARLIEMGDAHRAGGGNKVGVVLAKYVLHIETRRRPSTVKIRRDAFKAFGAQYGELAVADLKHHHVYEFLARQRARQPGGTGAKGRGRPRGWGDGNTRIFLTGVQAALNWAVKSGLIPTNPLRGVEMPQPRSRSREALVTPEQHRKLLELASPRLRPVIVCLENSGARPGELTAATAKDWDDALGALVYHADTTRREDEFGHKTSREKDRIIVFTGEALEIMRGLVAAHPTGPLFRNRTGRPWTPTTIWERFKKLREQVGNPHLTPYSYRHTIATGLLKAGRSIDLVAALLGNTPNIIRHHYSHLLGDVQGLRAELEKFRAESQAPPASPPAPPVKLHEPGEGAA